MFGKKKRQALVNAVDDTRSIVKDFRRRLPYESYRTIEYKLYNKLEDAEMKSRLDEHLEKLFAGELDDGNSSYLDSIIFAPAREAKPELSVQHYDHKDMLRRLIARRKSDQADFSRIAADRRKELEELEAAYEMTCSMLAKINCEED